MKSLQRLIMISGVWLLLAAGLMAQDGERAAFLGISVSPLPPVLRSQLALSENIGLVIETVHPGGPAARDGLQQWDVLLQINDVQLTGESDLAGLVAAAAPGDVLSCRIVRKAKPEQVAVALGERPKMAAADFSITLNPVITSSLLPGQGTGSFVIQDGRFTIHGSRQKKGLRLLVTERGKSIFNGPAETEEQLAKLPAEVRRLLDENGFLVKP